jgi:hypothetical protein
VGCELGHAFDYQCPADALFAMRERYRQMVQVTAASIVAAEYRPNDLVVR